MLTRQLRLTGILSCVRFFPSRRSYLALFGEFCAVYEIGSRGTGIAVFSWQYFSWNFGFGMCRSIWQSVIVVLGLSYLALNRGDVCGAVVVDAGLRRSRVYIM